MLRTVGYSKMSWCVACNDVEIVLLNGRNNIYGVNECRVILKKTKRSNVYSFKYVL